MTSAVRIDRERVLLGAPVPLFMLPLSPIRFSPLVLDTEDLSSHDNQMVDEVQIQLCNEVSEPSSNCQICLAWLRNA